MKRSYARLSVPSVNSSGVRRVCGQEISIDSRRRRSAATAPKYGGQQQMRAASRREPTEETQQRIFNSEVKWRRDAVV